ncbi:MAG: homocysteine S-methyltransferase family protein [Lentisphaeria bacterium]|nr:MAG: homocysteine S-methyltransferase family protein [Lentisphaeria bacterium]
MRGLIDGGVDGFAIETMMDLQEARAALIAVRELCDLPAIVTLTFEPGGRTLTGVHPVSALVTLQALGADAFGCNCSTGPAEMAEVIRYSNHMPPSRWLPNRTPECRIWLTARPVSTSPRNRSPKRRSR